MPRGKKTQSGDPAQKVESVTGQRYGEGVAQEQMQKAMPAPNAQRTTQSAMAPRVCRSVPAITTCQIYVRQQTA